MTTTPTIFQDSLEIENQNMPIVETWLTGLFNLNKVWGATLEEQKEFDIDLHALTLTGKEVTFEVKIRYKFYEDLLIETLSCIKEKTQGWIYKSAADYLAYVFVVPNKPIIGDVLNLPGLKKWWRKQGVYFGYPLKKGTTHTINGTVLYQTQNRAVPLRHIPFNLFHAHRQYDYLKSLTPEDEYQELAER